jgi:galactose mutarotase-like enzyme
MGKCLDELPGAILTAGPARAWIARRGAECRQWSIGGVDLLWPGDPAVWLAIAPVLFPVVGWTRNGQVRVAGRVFQLGVHGFAAAAEFELAHLADDHASFVLNDGPQTRAVYPFGFRLEIDYRLSATALAVTMSVTNTGAEAMPHAIGLHPGFRWPMAGSTFEHAIIFESPEHPEVPVIAPGGLFSAGRRSVPLDGAVLRLDADLFANEALCFLDVASRTLLYDNGAGQGLSISLENFPHVALWARPPAAFLAIEAWTGHGDPEYFEGDLFNKPSMIILPPGASSRHAVRYEYFSDTRGWNAGLPRPAVLPKER